MNPEALHLFWIFTTFVILLFITGIYCILLTLNLIRALIGFEIMIKAVTLLIILAGYMTGQEALAQALVITLIVIEVVIMVVAGGVVLNIFRHHDSIDTRELRELKG